MSCHPTAVDTFWRTEAPNTRTWFLLFLHTLVRSRAQNNCKTDCRLPPRTTLYTNVKHCNKFIINGNNFYDLRVDVDNNNKVVYPQTLAKSKKGKKLRCQRIISQRISRNALPKSWEVILGGKFWLPIKMLSRKCTMEILATKLWNCKFLEIIQKFDNAIKLRGKNYATIILLRNSRNYENTVMIIIF